MAVSSQRKHEKLQRAVEASHVLCILAALSAQGCALPTERKELLALDSQVGGAGAPSGAGSSEDTKKPAASTSTSTSTSTPTSSQPAAGAGSPAGAAPMSSGAVSEPDAGTSTPPASTADAGIPPDAGKDECGADYYTCLITDPLNFEQCARMFCSALALTGADASALDAGADMRAECSMMFGDCLALNPQNTAECMAKFDKCNAGQG